MKDMTLRDWVVMAISVAGMIGGGSALYASTVSRNDVQDVRIQSVEDMMREQRVELARIGRIVERTGAKLGVDTR